MPHLTLEVTGNLPELDHRALFASLHQVLTAEGIPLGNCKSRVVTREKFFIDNGHLEHAFAHLEVKFVEGRPDESRARIGSGMLERLVSALGEPEGLKVQVTVHVTEMKRAAYFKFPGGTIGP